MLFHRSRIKNNNISRKISINEINIDKVSYAKFLSVIIDQKLSWAYHVNYIQNKLSNGQLLFLISKEGSYYCQYNLKQLIFDT